MTAEEERTRLIGDIARVLREAPVPDDARAAALTFIGWLARRMPGEPVSHCDIRRCKGLELAVSVSVEYEGPPSMSKPRGSFNDDGSYEPGYDAAGYEESRPRSAR